jgi:hypothetical protein
MASFNFGSISPTGYSSFGNQTFSDIGGAVSDLFAVGAYKAKAAGAQIEGQEYQLAAGLARKNVEFTKESTAIQEAQASRKIAMSLGTTEAEVGAAGFQQKGSALDILRSATEQGALTKAVTQQQGLITQAGYEEQAASYDLMAQAAQIAAQADQKAAQGSMISGIIKGVAAGATLFV